MSWIGEMFKRKNKNSATIAKDRLMIAIASDRENNIMPFLDEMKAEIIKVVERYTKIEDINIKKESSENIDTLEIEVIVPRS
jgi:cell division topological specificity factor